MYILTLSHVKFLFGFGIACLLVQLLFVSYYNETTRPFYNLFTSIVNYNLSTSIVEYNVPPTSPVPKPRPNLSSILDMVDHKIQDNEIKVDHLLLCPEIPPALNGTVSLIQPAQEKLEEVAQQLAWLRLFEGGHQMPFDCQARNKIAIIVPYRDRLSNLCWLLLNLHSFLTKQQLDYTIFVVEQYNESLTVQDSEPFNRGMLMNVGFTEALKLNDFDCFFFHDVDLIPLNYRNIYNCPDQPRHMAVAVDKWRYRFDSNLLYGYLSNNNNKRLSNNCLNINDTIKFELVMVEKTQKNYINKLLYETSNVWNWNINYYDHDVFSLPYQKYFGGVVAMSQAHFKLINGYSNMYWGWGAEDDDLRNRVIAKKLKIIRYPPDVARYQSCSHKIQTANPKRRKLLSTGFLRIKTDGLNSLKYKLIALKKFQIFTYLLVDLSSNPI